MCILHLRTKRQHVLLGQPYYAVAKKPKSHVHMAHVLCNTRAERLRQRWVWAPGTWLCPQKLFVAAWDMPAPHTVPLAMSMNHSSP